jgi:HlyD family secretion protein
MNRFLPVLAFAIAFAQEPAVPKDSVSIHLVELGNMPLVESAEGSVTSLDPPRVVVNFAGTAAGRCQPGSSARVVLDSPRPIPGKVLQRSAEGAAGGCEIELAGPLPAGIGIGARAGSLVEAGLVKDTMFFGRPAGSQADSTAVLFVLEPGASGARRVTVRYGKMSGPLIQILRGLAPGDRVIVTDMSKYAGFARVALR